jgi:hypothetical protein
METNITEYKLNDRVAVIVKTTLVPTKELESTTEEYLWYTAKVVAHFKEQFESDMKRITGGLFPIRADCHEIYPRLWLLTQECVIHL